MNGIGVVGLYVRDQDEALDFYVNRLGFQVHTDVRNGDYRWLTVQHPEQPSLQLGLFAPQALGLHDIDPFGRDATVWSVFGMGYLFIPLVLPILGLFWLSRHRPDDGASADGARS